MGSDLDITAVRNLDTLLEQLPAGGAARRLAVKLGVWTESSHDRVVERKRPYPTEFARLGDDALSNTNAYWISELARVTELVGLLEGHKLLLALQIKQARAAARGRVRNRHGALPPDADPGTKLVKPTATQIADESEADPAVVDVETTAALLDLAAATTRAYKDATTAVVAGISREISFRQAQYSARLRG